VDCYEDPRGYLGDFETREGALRAVSLEMEESRFWPNVWSLSDHGNLFLLSDWRAELEPGEQE
jgi:hypothetical protein